LSVVVDAGDVVVELDVLLLVVVGDS